MQDLPPTSVPKDSSHEYKLSLSRLLAAVAPGATLVLDSMNVENISDAVRTLPMGVLVQRLSQHVGLVPAHTLKGTAENIREALFVQTRAGLVSAMSPDAARPLWLPRTLARVSPG